MISRGTDDLNNMFLLLSVAREVRWATRKAAAERSVQPDFTGTAEDQTPFKTVQNQKSQAGHL